MSAAIAALFEIIQLLLPLVGGNSTVVSALVSKLATLVPLAVQEATDLVPEVKNIISVLSSSGGATDADLAALAALDAECDAAFDAAAAAAQAAIAADPDGP